jgi:hypothetical protein
VVVFNPHQVYPEFIVWYRTDTAEEQRERERKQLAKLDKLSDQYSELIFVVAKLMKHSPLYGTRRKRIILLAILAAIGATLAMLPCEPEVGVHLSALATIEEEEEEEVVLEEEE